MPRSTGAYEPTELAQPPGRRARLWTTNTALSIGGSPVHVAHDLL